MEIPEFCTRPRRSTRSVTKKRKTDEEQDPDYNPEEKLTDASDDKKEKEIVKKPVRGRASKIAKPEAAQPTPGNAEASTSTAAVGAASPTPIVYVSPDPQKKKPWEERSVIQRSKKLIEALEKPKAILNVVSRPEYQIEDWRKKMAEAKAARKAERQLLKKKLAASRGTVAKRGRGGGGRRGGGAGGRRPEVKKAEEEEEDEEDDKEFDVSDLRPLHQLNNDPCSKYLETKKIIIDNFNFDKLPNWVMGKGKGEPHGPPKYEYGTLWNYELMPIKDPKKPFDEPWKDDAAKPPFIPEILSMVASFQVGRALDLKTMAEKCVNIEYHPERYAPLIMRVRNPKCTALMFRSGRVILTGIKSYEEAHAASKKYVKIIRRALEIENLKILGFVTQNVSAHVQLPFRVRIHQLALCKNYGNLSYEPEMFPGLIIPLEYPRVKVIVFCNGSVILTGARKQKDLETAFEATYPLLKMYAP